MKSKIKSKRECVYTDKVGSWFQPSGGGSALSRGPEKHTLHTPIKCERHQYIC